MQRIMADINNLPSYFLEQLQDKNLFYDEDLTGKEIPSEILGLIPVDVAVKYHVIPIGVEDNRLTIITDTEQTFKQKSQLEKAISYTGSIKIMLAREEKLQQALAYFYNAKAIKNGNKNNQNNSISAEDITPLRGAINSMLQTAATVHASDIHILPYSHGIYVHFRVHGHLVDYSSNFNFDSDQALNITNLIKQMDTSGRVDQTRTNMPNEGSFSLYHGNKEIFVRMETLPVGNQGTMEKINLRLLPQATDSHQSALSLDDIGYFKEDLEAIKKVLYKNATGIFITSGPTGAGKTTSLYAQINYVRDLSKEPLIVNTIDDPIEIRDERFVQVQVREAQSEDISLSDEKIFKAGLRSDPDIFLYNEIRTAAAAETAIKASSTGHKTFSTVHASNCLNTIMRLLDLKISAYSLLSELKLVISQRLVATLCPHCSVDHSLTAEELAVFDDEERRFIEEGTMRGEFRIKSRNRNPGHSCPHCNNTGFSGRVAVAEFIELTDELRDSWMKTSGFMERKLSLKKANFKSMWEKGIDLALHGQVEIGEIIRVIGHD